jgi:hypothetical protein
VALCEGRSTCCGVPRAEACVIPMCPHQLISCCLFEFFSSVLTHNWRVAASWVLQLSWHATDALLPLEFSSSALTRNWRVAASWVLQLSLDTQLTRWPIPDSILHVCSATLQIELSIYIPLKSSLEVIKECPSDHCQVMSHQVMYNWWGQLSEERCR